MTGFLQVLEVCGGGKMCVTKHNIDCVVQLWWRGGGWVRAFCKGESHIEGEEL